MAIKKGVSSFSTCFLRLLNVFRHTGTSFSNAIATADEVEDAAPSV